MDLDSGCSSQLLCDVEPIRRVHVYPFLSSKQVARDGRAACKDHTLSQ